MKLTIYGQPLAVNSDQQEIKAVYGGRRRDLTEIFINADVVTIGVVAKVLDEIYRETLSKIPPAHAAEIESTIERVINDERH